MRLLSPEELFAIGHNELDYVHTTPNSQIILDKFLRENERLFNRIAKAQAELTRRETLLLGIFIYPFFRNPTPMMLFQ